MMKKYGLIKNGMILAFFYSKNEKKSYPDIEKYLIEIPEDVQCNWGFVDGKFISNEIKIDQGEEDVQVGI